MIKAKAEFLFEVSWEVCNKVGGIYTVVKSKAELMKSHYENYILIGPYIKEKADVDLKKERAPPDIQQVFEKLKSANIRCYYGKWQIKGEPDVILVDFSKLIDEKNKLKEQLWNDYRIDSLRSGWSFEEPVIWSAAVAKLLEELCLVYNNKKIVAHFHEWMAGSALLHLKKRNVGISTVFTTHATMLGRTLAGSGQDLYARLDQINPEEEAYKSSIEDKFTTERACAKAADVFTTVSEITSIEAEKILGRKADVLVLNGLDIAKFPTMEEVAIKHVTCRDKIREFLIFHFFPYYTFDLNHTMLLFIVGRYEYRNKGIDIFIEALTRLNERLKKEKSKRTVAAFFWIPQETKGVKTELLENKNYYRHIKNFVNFNSEKILANLIYDLVSHKHISKEHLFTKDFVLALKKDLLQFKRKGNPPFVTHNISNEQNDEIVQSLVRHGLDNKKDDNVKTILYPVYLDGNDGLINLPYYDAMAGCHLGLFPSYYEPWGYTPLEAAALGVPSVTSDLSGFGMFIKHNLKHNMDDGIFVLKRYQKTDEDAIKEFTELLYKFCKRNKNERAKNKLSAKEFSGLADWKILIENYIKAHNLALEKHP